MDKLDANIHTANGMRTLDMNWNTYFGPSSRLSRSEPPRFISRGVFCSWVGVLTAGAVDGGFGARPRDVDDVFKLGAGFSTGITSFDGVDARESLSLPAAFDSGFFGFDAVTTLGNQYLD